MAREGRTSMQIAVEAWITRMPAGDHMRVTRAMFTFVAIDEDGKPRALPPS
jgi:acyl-CoA thioesterase YciA